MKIEIINKFGMYVWVVVRFVIVVQIFSVQIIIDRNGYQVNGKSIMGVMMLVVLKGMVINFIIDGEDEQQVIEVLCILINNCFDEDE